MRKININKTTKSKVNSIAPSSALQTSMEDFFGNSEIDLTQLEAGTYTGTVEKVTEVKSDTASYNTIRVKVAEHTTLTVNVFDNQTRMFLSVYNLVNGTSFTDIHSLAGRPLTVYRYALTENKFKNVFVPELPIGEYVGKFVAVNFDMKQAVITIVYNVNDVDYFKSFNYEADKDVQTRIANEIYFLAYALGFENKVSYSEVNSKEGTPIVVKSFIPNGLKNAVVNFSKVKAEKTTKTSKVTRRY